MIKFYDFFSFEYLHCQNNLKKKMSRQIINVKGADGIIVGISLSQTGVLTRSALETAFANSLCLKYKNEIFGFDQTTEQSYIIVNFDENVKAFIEPAGGWMGKTYEVVYRAKGYSIFNVLHYPSKINLLFPFLASLGFETYITV
ncbi:unnamed protein product [Meloidogyne enterolobii]|uniref:Uncharacterized protein n=1 Tax=Meloidogyne enterolobii TaxID=390850 RepID=A0ACB0YRL9_MELEN